jgi:hypothetical protein
VQQKDVDSDHPAAVSDRGIIQLSRFSEPIVARLARIYVERDAIFKLRYHSYRRAALIPANAFSRYIESSDHAESSYLIGLYVDRTLIATLRLQIGNATATALSPPELFPRALKPLLKGNKTVVHMSCVATHPDLACTYAWLPYFILRSWIVAAQHFQADTIAAAVRPQHQVFYRRVLECQLHGESWSQPRHLAPVGLVSLDFAASARRLYENIPFLRSTRAERQQLFAPEVTPSRATTPSPDRLVGPPKPSK